MANIECSLRGLNALADGRDSPDLLDAQAIVANGERGRLAAIWRTFDSHRRRHLHPCRLRDGSASATIFWRTFDERQFA
jgi:hypothetical protein